MIKDINKAANDYGAFVHNYEGKCSFVKILEDRYEDADISVMEGLWKPLMDAVKNSGYHILDWEPSMELLTDIPYKTYVEYCNGGHCY